MKGYRHLRVWIIQQSIWIEVKIRSQRHPQQGNHFVLPQTSMSCISISYRAKCETWVSGPTTMSDTLPTRKNPERCIIHIDMDCFYAAIEIREQPELRGKPVAVGGRSGRGVLTTCNYEAREFGCRSAMPTYRARQLCPDLIVLSPQFQLYRRESNRIREILRSYTDLVEPLSLDEAYLDATSLARDGWTIASEIRKRIRSATDLTASAGIGPNKLLAKIASDWRKPDGQFEVKPEGVAAFMQELGVGRIRGIGPKSAALLKGRGIETCGQLQRLTLLQLHGLMGKFGEEIFRLCRGLDSHEVEPYRIRKSMSTERTFERDLRSLDECVQELEKLHHELVQDLKGKSSRRAIHKIFVKLKFADFRQTTRECVARELSFSVVQRLLDEAFTRSDMGIRLLGVGVRFREDPSGNVEQLEIPFEI